ncbi:MAG: RluA family pseudouridine synthase, partial [Bacteroidales bacterium]
MIEEFEEIDEIQEEDLPPAESNEMYEHYSVLVDKGQTPLRIDKYLTLRILNATRTRIQSAADAG